MGEEGAGLGTGAGSPPYDSAGSMEGPCLKPI